jgi:NADPH2:quinone reductase
VGRTKPASDTPAAQAIDEFVNLEGSSWELGDEIKRRTGGRGADVVYDAVGGVTTAAALASLAPRGRLVVISAVGTRTVEIDLIDFYHNETRLLGSESRRLDIVASGEGLALLAPYFESGDFRPLPISRRYDLEDGRAAYRAVADRAPGRIVIRP